MVEHVSGIYKIEHVASGNFYIGSSVDIHKRWVEHQRRLHLGQHNNIHLQRAWNLYGSEAFTVALLEVIRSEKQALVEAEQRWISSLKPAYNLSPVAGSTLGLKLGPFTEEHRKKISAKLTGRTRSPEHCAAISQAKMGKPLTEEHRQKDRDSQLGRKHSAETKAKIGAAHRGRPKTEEAKRKSRETQLGRVGRPHTPEELQKQSETSKRIWAQKRASGEWPIKQEWTEERRERQREISAQFRHTPETRARLSEIRRQFYKEHPLSDEDLHRMGERQRGRTQSAETRAKIRQAQLGKIIPPESRAKMSEAAKRRCERQRHDREVMECSLMDRMF